MVIEIQNTEESSAKDYQTKGYYQIHYEDRTIILRTKLK